MSARPHRWITYRKAKPQARVRVFCFPYAGGGASLFRPWAAAAPDDLDICPVQLPGREHRLNDLAHARIGPLVDELCTELAESFDAPYALFGYSMGALIAFELARALTRRGAPPPLHLVVASRRGPRLPDPRPPVHALPDDRFLATVGGFDGTPREVLQDPDVLKCFLPTLRADFALCETYAYVPGELLECPLTVYGARDDRYLPQPDLEAWSAETRSRCHVQSFSGGHFFVRDRSSELLAAMSAAVSATLPQPALLRR